MDWMAAAFWLERHEEEFELKRSGTQGFGDSSAHCDQQLAADHDTLVGLRISSGGDRFQLGILGQARESPGRQYPLNSQKRTKLRSAVIITPTDAALSIGAFTFT